MTIAPSPDALTVVTLTLIHPHSSTPLQQWNFENESIIRIGRSPDNHIVLSDALVSRHHLELRKIGAEAATNSTSLQWQLISQGTNGTFVDGILVSQGLVSHDSLIQLARGGPVLKFQLRTHKPQGRRPSSGVTIPPQLSLSSPFNQSTGAVKVPSASSQPSCTHAGNPPNNLFCIHCGRPLAEVQRVIRQYQVLRTLGKGGMGTTYLAWDAERPRGASLLVLKEMNADMAQNSKARELFEREARTLKGLNHPGIPTYYDFFVEGGKKYLAMELIQGEDLEKRVYQKGPVPLKQAAEWMIQTCNILNYIHSEDPPLIHRDIKPANLMVRFRDNRVVLLDFGAVKEIGTAPGTRIGAPDYSAPEQDRGQPCTQSDLYAIGPTLIFLLAGESPQRFFVRKGIGYRFDVEGIPTITPQLRAIIERVTEPKPSDRYKTAKELSQALTACL